MKKILTMMVVVGMLFVGVRLARANDLFTVLGEVAVGSVIVSNSNANMQTFIVLPRESFIVPQQRVVIMQVAPMRYITVPTRYYLLPQRRQIRTTTFFWFNEGRKNVFWRRCR